MLTNFLKHRWPQSTVDCLFAIDDLVCLNMRPGESSGEFMARLRIIEVRLQGMTIDEVLPLIAMSNTNQDLHPALMTQYIQGDTSVVNATVYTIESDMDQEDLCCCALIIGPHLMLPISAAQHVGTATQTTPLALAPIIYISVMSFVDWRVMGLDIEVLTQCLSYFYRHSDPNDECIKFHREVGCSGMDGKGVVCKKDAKAAASIIQQ